MNRIFNSIDIALLKKDQAHYQYKINNKAMLKMTQKQAEQIILMKMQAEK